MKKSKNTLKIELKSYIWNSDKEFEAKEFTSFEQAYSYLNSNYENLILTDYKNLKFKEAQEGINRRFYYSQTENCFYYIHVEEYSNGKTTIQSFVTKIHSMVFFAAIGDLQSFIEHFDGRENVMALSLRKAIENNNIELPPKSNFLATRTQRHKETLSLRFWISFLCESWCLSVLVAKFVV